MFGISRNRLTGISSALAMALVLAPMLVTPASAKGPVTHHVSAGGPDACEAINPTSHPGCNGNFSLVANVYADGSVSGQYTDQFGHGNGGFHAVVDCVSIFGNTAWVSGVIKQGNLGTADLAGVPVVTRVQDNGKSANDPPDKISYSWIYDARPCTLRLNYPLLDAPEGQVTVD
jgi:hypothetical protein